MKAYLTKIQIMGEAYFFIITAFMNKGGDAYKKIK
jgi:hypothetical protein